jgi:type I restriction enzyme R subunit
MAERARLVQDKFEQRQTTTSEALDKLLTELSRNEERKQQQAEQGFDDLTFFVYRSLLEANINNPEAVCNQIRSAFGNHPNWRTSEAALRELRNQVTFALYAACDQHDQVTPLVDALISTLTKGDRIG